jgi:hypothetical protein
VLDEGCLHGMELVALFQTLNRCDFVAIVSDGEPQTGINTPAASQHGAGSALTVIAALFGAGEL